MSKVTALQLMRFALQQYAYKEHPAGSNNTKFGKAIGCNYQPWCASYVWWSGWKAAGEDQSSNPIYKSANAADIQSGTVNDKGGKYVLKQTANNTKKKEALPKIRFGDSISFNFSGGTSRAHTALVVGRWGNYIWCIEGNTSFSNSGSQSNGGCVALRERFYTTGVCIVRPDYKAHEWHVPKTAYKGKTVKLPNRGWMQYGDNNSKVAALQEALTWANGYTLDADSDFGAKTFAEVVIFQVAHGLEPDGEFGEKCLEKLTSIIKKNAGEKPENQPVDEEKNESDIITQPTLHVPKKGEKCLDLSNHQGKLSADYFKGVKKNGVTSVILRSSYTRLADPFRIEKDAAFDHNVKNASKAGLHIGAYHYSAALTTGEAKKEAEFCLKTIEPHKDKIDLPIAFDCEFGETSDSRFKAKQAKALGKTKMGKIIYTFTDAVKAAGYEPMIYANLTMFNNYLPADIHSKLKIWIAQYNKTCDYKHSYYLWQYTSNNGKLDEDIFGSQGTKSTKTKGEKIASEAKKCSYPLGTSKKVCGYPDGKPKPEYKEALDKAYPDRSKWGKQTRAGASCDVFVGTVIRASGADKSFPRGLDEVEAYMKKHTDKWKKTTVTSEGKMKPGDVIFELYKGGGGHISIYLGNGKIANAHYNGKTYGLIQKYASQIKGASKCQTFTVYRVKG